MPEFRCWCGRRAVVGPVGDAGGRVGESRDERKFVFASHHGTHIEQEEAELPVG